MFQLGDSPPQEDPDFRGTMERVIAPPTVQRSKTQFLLLSLLAFIAASFVSNAGASVIEIGTLVGVILFHELGHMIMMRIVGYRDVRIFFIPFFGGAAAGRKRGVARWKEAIVLLAGPLPGIVLGIVLAYVGGNELVRTIALQLIFVNALNLLPIAPLDGGQLFQVLLFSRQRHLELVFVGITAALVVIGALYAKLWVLAIIGYLIVVTLPHKKRVLEVAHSLREQGLPADPAVLDENQQRDVYARAMAALPPTWREKWRGNEQAKAQMIEEIVERATQRPPSLAATGGLLGVWLVSLAAALFGLFLAIGPSWRPYTNADGRFAVEMPGTPVASEQAGFHAVSTRVGRDREYSVLWNDVLDTEGWLTAVHDGLASKNKVTDLATSAAERTFTYREGSQVVLMRLIGTPQGRVYMVGAASGDDDDADSRRFIDSFRVLPR